MTAKTRRWAIALGLALLAPLLLLILELSMLYFGFGSFSTLVEGLSGKESVEEVSVEDYRELIVPVGDRYLFEQLYVLGPIVMALVALAYGLLVTERNILHHVCLAFPLAVFVSWPLGYRFVTAWVLYFAVGLLVAMAVSAWRRRRISVS